MLSGFVLSLGFWKGRRQESYLQFVVRRTLRIYPATLFSILLSVALSAAFGGEAPSWVSYAVPSMWQPPSMRSIAAEALGWVVSGETSIVSPMWSLVHEMRISLMFPLLILFMIRCGRWSFFFALAFSTGAAVMEKHTTAPLALSLLATSKYVWLFVLGAEIARNRVVIGSRLRRLPLWSIAMIVFAGLVLSHARWIFPTGRINAIVSGLGSGIVVSAIATTSVGAGLKVNPFRFLGRVSYSLYLVHLPVLYTAVLLTRQGAPALPLAVGIMASLPVAWLSYELVEKYGMRWRPAIIFESNRRA